MSEDFKEPVSGADEAKPPKKNAEDNPWYLLATLYGVGQYDKNRRAWNRYFAGSLDPKTRAKLIEEKRHPAEELTPFSWVELRMVERLFSKRKGSANFICPRNTDGIDFSNVQFDQDVDFNKCPIPESDFRRTIFHKGGSFKWATFLHIARFQDSRFFNSAIFHGATFFDRALFDDVTFHGGVFFEGATFSQWAEFNSAIFSGEGSYEREIVPQSFEKAIFQKSSSLRQCGDERGGLVCGSYIRKGTSSIF